MAEITDPEIVRQFSVGRSSSAPTEVTDPDILRQFKPQSSSWMDFLKSIPTGVVRGLAGTAAASGQAEASLTGMEGVPGAAESEKLVERGLGRRGVELHEPAGKAGQYGASIGRALGEPTTYLGPGGLVRKAITGVTGAVGAELGGQLTKDSMAGRIIGGVAGGLLPGVVGGAARRIAAPAPMLHPETRAPAVALLRREGIEPSAGDVSGSANVRRLEEASQRIGGGGRYSELKDRPLRQLTSAVTAQMGESAEQATPELIQRANARIGAQIQNAQRRLNVTHDRRLTTDIAAIETDITKNPWMSDQLRGMVREQIRSIMDGFITRTVRGNRAPVGVMPGTTYVALTAHDTPLGLALRSPDAQIARYARQIRTALDNAMERSANARGTRPGVGRRQALADLREARRQWYIKLVVEKAMIGSGEDAARGIILPERLRAALVGTKANKLGYAEGRNYLDRLSRAANAVLTPERRAGLHQLGTHGTGALLGAGAGALVGHPYIGAAVGAVAPRLAATGPGQALLKRQRAPAQPTYPGAAALRGGYQGRRDEKRKPPRLYGGTDSD